MPFDLFSTFLLVALSFQAQSEEGSGTTEVKKPKAVTLIELKDGAESPKEALLAFVAASQAADDEAALLMIDPQIRTLLRPEMEVEDVILELRKVELFYAGDRPEKLFGALRVLSPIVIAYASRDLANLNSAEILDSRTIDDSRVVFKTLTTQRSYHDDGTTRTVQEFLAIRSDRKWYVFRPIGMLIAYLRNDFGWSQTENGETLPGILQIERNIPIADGKTADFVVSYRVSIESIHKELAAVAKSEAAVKNLRSAERLRRLMRVVELKARQGDFKNRKELQEAFKAVETSIDELIGNSVGLLTPSINRMAKQAEDANVGQK